MIVGLPWWVLIMIVLIFVSGYMAFRAMQAERKLEEQFAEREGKIYMDRIMAERENRQRQKGRQNQL